MSLNLKIRVQGLRCIFWISRTGAITLGEQNFAVTQDSANSPTNVRTQFDYDGDGRVDVAVFRPSGGAWYLNRSQARFTGIQFGMATDSSVSAAFVR